MEVERCRGSIERPGLALDRLARAAVKWRLLAEGGNVDASRHPNQFAIFRCVVGIYAPCADDNRKSSRSACPEMSYLDSSQAI